jgi:FkbM family methyltransferase
MNIKEVFQFINNHPLTQLDKIKSFRKLLIWKFQTIINNKPVIYPYIQNSKLIVSTEMTSSVENMLTGLFEFEDMSFLLHYLDKEDVFADIGANIGIYTILASKVTGATSLAFEPSSKTFVNLINNITINSIQDKVFAYKLGLGSSNSEVSFSKEHDTMNYIVSEPTTSESVEKITIKKLDDVVTKNVNFIKMDVEGFETEVLKGAERILRSTDLNVIIIELNGFGKRYGFKDEDIHALLTSFGFSVYKYLPFERKLIKQGNFNSGNNIYLKDYEYAQNRVRHSGKIEIGKILF